MAINNNDIRVKRTKKLLRKGLAELAKTKNINKITVKELTDLVEINRGTFYLHYKDVYDLVDSIEDELCDEFDQELLAIMPDDLLRDPVTVIETYFNYYKNHADILSVLMGENGDAKFVHRFGKILNTKIYELFIQIFPNMDKEKYDYTYEFCKFGFVGILNAWMKKYPNHTTCETAEKFFSLSIGAIWNILGDEGKEVLINAHNAREDIHS